MALARKQCLNHAAPDRRPDKKERRDLYDLNTATVNNCHLQER